MGRSYLRPLSFLLLTVLSHLTTPSVVLAARRGPSSLQLGDVDLAHLTLVRGSGNGLAERANSGTNLGDLAERVNSGTNPGDLAKRMNSDTNPGDLAGRIDLSINHGDLAKRYPDRIRVACFVTRAASLQFGCARHVHLGGCFGGRLRFSMHPLIEECLGWWRISHSQVVSNSLRYLVVFLGECQGAEIIPTRDLFMACFRLCKSQGGYYLTAQVSFRVNRAPSNNKGWKSRYLFVSGPVWGFRLDWSAHPIGNVPPYLSEEEFILVDKLKGILFFSHTIKEMTKLWLVKAGLSLASRDRMDLGDLCGMPKVFGGKASLVRTVVPAREVGISLAREAPKASSMRLIDAPTEQVYDSDQRQKKVKVLMRRYKSRNDEGGSRSHSKGKEPIAPSEEPETPVESDEGDVSPVHHHLRSMKDIFKTKVHKDDAGYYALHMSDLGHQDLDKEMKARWGGGLKNSMKMTLFDRVHDAGQLITFKDYRISHFQQELDTLKSGGGPEAVAKAEERTSELEQELEKTKREQDEALQLLEASEKELNEVQSNLA
ncbi:hypothetical protein B296_00039245 [Ensete ventricosum]|uniref:Uncharacterized protein n=1 Tax=Ensete ventricosum TaxID=4639 RepID=A0A426XFD3_ENSVE|nr:hypothetical protein B296_00039245 [Ensete ventricosum]